ncbi:ammonium transporter [Arachidicoccus rhizosphaerae]|uniref:Ammonium transporter n=1 Tax=Arachidicoccus rhizosphaerae TaxID=551991 RepID=A0A1H4CV34_9BACT|nr:ammonium transporter [Arachidicoccus rhizosphaerae]SEA64176.1 ammonium transporter [Arachidicoccus rhizosphaerae]
MKKESFSKQFKSRFLHKRFLFPVALGALFACLLIMLNTHSSYAQQMTDSSQTAVDSVKNVAAVATDTPAAAAPVTSLSQDVANILWLCLCAFLVFFMQAGFAMVESGMTRAKNAVNIMMKNLLDFCFGAVLFWAVGYAIMYSSGDHNFFGFDPSLAFLGTSNAPTDLGGYSLSASWLFQVVFAATAATIVSGAMAERTKLISYIIYSCIISLVVYPVSGHWIWGGGWLSDLGFRDFAGSTVVHSLGGWASLAGAIMVGPRLGKYNKDGSVNNINPHNMPLAALGVFILWFGWYGFNPGSTLTAVGGVAHVAVTTTLAAATGAIGALITSWVVFKKPDLSMTLNGTLAGLVGITAPCASVSTGSAALIGLIAGILVFYSCLFVERKLKVDDPVGAISVHGICGAWGTLAVGLFGQRAIDLQYWSADTAIKDGLFFGGGFHQLGVQAFGVLAVFAYAMIAMFIVFYLIKKVVGLRVSDAEQKQGLDLGEHNNTAYGGFVLDAEGDHAIIVIE